MGIEVREALPVGENLQDHCMCNLNYTTTGPSLFDAVSPENFALFESEGRGPLTSNIPEGAGLLPGAQRRRRRPTSSSTSPPGCSTTEG